MAKMIPKIISDSASIAEKKVFYELEKLNDDYTIFHSVNLPKHLYKIEGEIDFVIICKLGILCLEVKGGYVERKEGIWKFTDKNGNTNEKSEGPYEQVEGNMYTLMKYLKDKFGEQSNIASTQFANAVFFTDIDEFVINDISFIKEITIDKNRLENNKLEKIIQDIYNYYSRRNYDTYHFYRRGLSEKDLGILSRFFSEDFGYSYSLKQEIKDVEKQIIKFTEMQQEAFKEMEDNDRIIIKGSGGTGKTLILYEQAVRQAIEGKKVIFICFNKLLSKFLNKKLDNEIEEIKNNIKIYQIHSYMISQIKKQDIEIKTNNGDSENFFENELPKEFLGCSNFEQQDVLIVDEAQDLLNYNYIDVLDKIVKNGLKDGNWYMALDPNQNLFNNEFFEVFEYIKSDIRPTIKKLNDNCRNTKQICYQNEMFTQIEQSKNEIINGQEVKYMKYLDNDEKIINIVKELKKEKIDLKDVVIISKYVFNKSVFKGENFLKNICQIKFAEDFLDTEKEGITFSTIQGFKGLESSVVILSDIDDLEKSKLLNYVAISRTKELLYVLLNENAFKEYEKNVIKTYEKIGG